MYIQGLTQEVGSGTFLEVLPNMKTVICYCLDSQNSLPGYHRGIMHMCGNMDNLYHPCPTRGVGSRLTIWGGVWLDFLATECDHT